MLEDAHACKTSALEKAATPAWTTNGDLSGIGKVLSMNELVLGLTHETGYGNFRDDAARKLGQRHGRRELRKRKLNMLAAALLLALAGFGATMLTMPPTSQASLMTAHDSSCVKAGQSLEPWFKTELTRRGLTGTAQRDDFNLMLVWFRNAKAQCATGLTQAASENLQVLADRIVTREELRQRADD